MSLPPSAPGADPRDQLRLATASLHDAVDAAMPLSREGASLADYACHLALLRGWVAALGPRAPSLSPRLAREAAALEADLAECRRLGAAAPGTPDAQDLPGGRDTATPGMPDIPSAAGAAPDAGADADGVAWGVRYVLEGSRLGGQVLYRRLADRLAPHPLGYLRGDGPATGARWRDFLAQLRGALDTPDRVQAACEGAVMAFALLLQCRAVRAPARANA